MAETGKVLFREAWLQNNFPDSIRTDAISGVWDFLNAIDWSEPWLIGLQVFHACCFILTFLTRKHINLQCAHFCVLLLLAYSAQYINEWAANNYKLFSKLQYFDSSGLFISLVLSLPLLLNCLIIVIMWFSASWDLMIKVKRSKIRSQIREARNSKKSAGNKEQDKGGAEDKKKD
ncbi:transmembrane protein 18-like [Branchiostoma floridae x Branchiostoma japonicum]